MLSGKSIGYFEKEGWWVRSREAVACLGDGNVRSCWRRWLYESWPFVKNLPIHLWFGHVSVWMLYLLKRFTFKKKSRNFSWLLFCSHLHADHENFLLALIQNLSRIWPFVTTSQLLILSKPTPSISWFTSEFHIWYSCLWLSPYNLLSIQSPRWTIKAEWPFLYMVWTTVPSLTAPHTLHLSFTLFQPFCLLALQRTCQAHSCPVTFDSLFPLPGCFFA